MFEGLRLAVIAAVMLLVPFAASAQTATTTEYNISGYILNCPSPGYSEVHPEIPSCTHNVLVQNVDQRVHRIIQELQGQVSGRVTGFSADDYERLLAEFAWLKSFINMGTANMMDFHYLATFELTPYEIHQKDTENETVNAVVGYLVGSNANLRVSSSTRLNDGMLDPDKKDLMDAISKAEVILTTEYTNSNPMDMPMSSPNADVVLPTIQ